MANVIPAATALALPHRQAHIEYRLIDSLTVLGKLMSFIDLFIEGRFTVPCQFT